MGMTVETSIPPVAVDFTTKLHRAMLAAATPILEAAAEGAPYEDVPRHGVHLRDTVFARINVGGDLVDEVQIGFTAFWAAWQHEHMDWHHEHGHALFLSLAMAAGGQAWLDEVGVAVFTRD